MPVLAVSRWVLLRLASSPWVLLVGVLMLGLIPLQQALSPLPSSSGALAQASLWAPGMATLGVLAGLLALSDIQSFLARLDPASRCRAELGALLTAGLLLLLPTLAGTLLAGAPPRELGTWAPAILTRLVHLASLALVLLHPSLPAAPRAALFVAATWLLPALCASAPSLTSLGALLDVQAPLGPPDAAGFPSALAAALGLLLAALLVRRVRAPDES